MTRYTILFVFFIITSCTTINVQLPTITPGSLTSQNIDYEIVGTAEGQACTESYNLLPFPIFWTKGDATEIAYQQALNSVSEADAIITPKIKKIKTTYGPWYSKTCVVVKGKAVKFKNRN